ncbi:hypothetical protein NEDG_01374 [Nematocida displodere]|uniref:Importin N-terminal domain-containing protein n=1 Tax=Nematocida displodere TaxID=1805483 RepID=A0A177ECQ0_9MICR|nr:hypothetical protein NEDG_01374 [Nematocida displodere]
MTAKQEINLRDSVLMTLQPDIEMKKKGEKHLETLSSAPGYLFALLQLSGSDEDPSVRMVTAVYFRRYLEKSWSTEDFPKDYLIEHFPSFLLAATKESERQLYSALEFILKQEDAEKWAPIIMAFERLIRADEPSSITTGLKIGNKLTVGFIDGYRSEKVFETFLDGSGIVVAEIGAKAIESRNFEVASLALKILSHASESYIVPNVFKQPVFIQNVVTLAALGSDPASGHTSLIKWSLVVVNNLMKKTRKKKEAPHFDCLTREPMLSAMYSRAIALLRICRERDDPQTTKIEKEALTYLKCLTYKKEGWAVIKRDSPLIISHFIIPALSFNEELESIWEDSQIEFMRHQEARYTHSPDTVASELFFEMCKNSKDEPETLSMFANLILSTTAAYSVAPSEETAKGCYGGLALFKTAAKYLKNVETVLTTVVSYLNAPHAIVKYMAFSTVQHFSYYKKLPEVVLDLFLPALESPDIAVVVEAILCLPQLLEVDAHKKKLKMHIPAFLKMILELSNKVQIEALATALEDVIVLCQEEALGIAPAIAEAISTSVLQLLQEGDGEEQPEEKYGVIDGYIRTIVTLIESLESSPESILAIVRATKPMVITIASTYTDFIIDVFPIVIATSYALKNVDSMYDILEAILKLSPEDLVVYASEVSGVLDNFITYGKEGILAYLGTILQMVGGMLEGYTSDYDHPYICRVLESIILNTSTMLGDKLPELLRTVISMALKNKDTFEMPSAIVAAIEIVLNAFIVSPATTLVIVREMGEMHYVVKGLSAHYKRFERVHDLKLLLLFSGVVLSQGAASTPEELSPELVVTLFHYALTRFPEALAYRESLKSGDAEYDEEYYDREYLDEDPSFETPLDAIDPYEYAQTVCSFQPGTLISSVWGNLSEDMRAQILSTAQNKK